MKAVTRQRYSCHGLAISRLAAAANSKNLFHLLV